MVKKMLNGNAWKVIVLFLGSGIIMTFTGLLWKASAICSRVEEHEKIVIQVPINTMTINGLQKDITNILKQLDKSDKKQEEIISMQIQILKEIKN